MCEPHLFRLCSLCQFCSLLKGHVLIFPGLLYLLFLTIHAFTDKQIRCLRFFSNNIHRSGICTICYFESFSCTSKHHVRCKYSSIVFHIFSFLQTIPEFLRNFRLLCPFYAEFSDTFNYNIVTITNYLMVYLKRFYPVAI